MELKDDPSCPYCNANFETLVHAFINCAAVKEFWKKIESWLQQVAETHTKIGDIEKIFGLDTSGCFINRAITFSIQVIYQKLQLGNLYHLSDVKRLLANQMMLEESISVTNNRLMEFENIWGSVYLELSGI